MLIKIALAGNPNSGKTTLFNYLTGSNQYVGNWPGVTVEKKEGRFKENKEVVFTDLPGIYSLSPYTLEEVVSRNYLLDEKPDVILNIIDGTNLERNLFLTMQLVELGIPMVVAINMMDVVRKNGDFVNTKLLSQILSCKVVEISALKGIGVMEAALAAIDAARAGDAAIGHVFSEQVEKALSQINGILPSLPKERRRWYTVKLFERDEKITKRLKLSSSISTKIEAAIKCCEDELDDDSESIITTERYVFIDSIIKKCYKIKRKGKMSTSDQIDRLVTNRWLALPIFALVMLLVYTISVTTVGGWATDWANDGVFGDGWHLFGIWVPGIPILVENGLNAINCAGWLQSLVLDGLVAGLGSVLGFVPQLLVLFIFLAFLEGCGYMARIAFILDRVFKKFGLSGKSFIPILIGTGCGVPGIMASRTIENERDRRMTIVTTTFIPCSAKLPIIALIAGALFGGAWWVAPSAYFIGIAAIISSGILLKKTKAFSGDATPFVMELPAYHWPTISSVLRSMWERASSFIKKAGTVILLSCVFVWFVSRFGWLDGSFTMLSGESLDNSILARLGTAFSWIFIPLGWGNWQATVAAAMGLVAKENVVGTLGILYGFAEVAEDGKELWGALASNFNVLSAFSFLVFNLLCAPCFAAMGAIRREMNSAKWFWFAVLYQTGLAYAVSLCIYQLGMLFTSGTITVSTVIALLLVIVFLGMLFRKNPNHKNRFFYERR